MAELKRNFLKAKMNKDLDERLISDGEYRDALNIKISSSEDSGWGTARTLDGNKSWDTNNVAKGSYNADPEFSYKSANTVGVYIDEENNAIYNFICGAQDLRSKIGGVGSIENKVGRRSDRIEQIVPHNTNPNLTKTKIVFEDVYEVRYSFSIPSTDNKSFIWQGKPENITLGCGQVIQSFGGIRAGMRVNAISATGSDLYGVENEVYVTSITKRSDNPELWDININKVIRAENLALSQNDINNNVVIKFSSPKILNFKKGDFQEQEVNNNNEISFTPNNSMITGINVIDEYLFFTDGRNEPKKINIKRSIDGTSQNYSNVIHTTLVVEYRNTKHISCFAKEEHITVLKKNPLKAVKVITGFNNNSSVLSGVPLIGSYATDFPFGNFSLATAGEFITAQTAYVEATNLYVKISPIFADQINLFDTITITGATTATSVKFEVVELPNEEANIDYYTLHLIGSIPTSYTDVPVDNVVSEAWIATLDNRSDLYSDDFIRFAYRYKYVDGETSCISPYSNPAFIPSTYSFSPKDGFNLGMENKIKDIKIRDYIEPNIPKDVVEVELIFKTQTSENFYSFNTIKRKTNIPYSISRLYTVNYDYDYFNSEDIIIKEKLSGTTIPSDQVVRVFDGVPLKAKAQEIQANRLMFANYTTDYDLLDHSNTRLSPNISSWVDSIPASFDANFTSTNVAWATTLDTDPTNYQAGSSSDWDNSIYINSIQGTIRALYLSSEISDTGNNFSNDIYTAPINGSYVFSGGASQVGRSVSNANGVYPCEVKLIILKVDNTGAPIQLFLPPTGMPQSEWSTSAASAVIPSTTITLNAGENVGLFVISKLPPNDETGPLLQYGTHLVSSPYLVVKQAPSIVGDLATVQGKPSIKSSRSYDVGVVYRDDLGRESTVVISEDQSFYASKSRSKFSNRLWAAANHNAPNWAKTYKFFIKEDSKKFYNIVMEAAYLSVFQDYVYLVFNNVDKDKVTTGDYLILKKKNNSNESVLFDEARYRVVSIIGESSLGTMTGDADLPATITATQTEGEGRFFVKIKYSQDNFGEYVADLVLEEDQALTTQGSNNGAVFEIEKHEPEDLDIFFEVSDTYAIKLDTEYAKTHIGKTDEVCVLNSDGTYGNLESSSPTKLKVVKVEGAISSGVLQKEFHDRNAYCVLTLNEDVSTSVPSGTKMQIKKYDGSSVSAKLGRAIQPGDKEVWLNQEVHPVSNSVDGAGLPICLPWFNCYSFGNGVESDTIRDDFNETTLWTYGSNVKQIGFKASLVDLDYKQRHQKYSIIYSQVYNEFKGRLSGSNRLNEFLLDLNIVKKLNPEYGSIQKLYSRDSDLLAFCEKKCLRILSEKDALYNADGQSQLLSSNAVLGEATPFKGDYGISKNPESFAVDEYRIYFTDKNRGAVLRLSMDGITNISNVGMKTWFADAMLRSEALVGSFDSKKEEYNIT